MVSGEMGWWPMYGMQQVQLFIAVSTLRCYGQGKCVTAGSIAVGQLDAPTFGGDTVDISPIVHFFNVAS